MMAYGEAFMSGLIPRDPSYPPYALASGAAALRIAGAFTFLQAVVCNTLADASAKGNLVKSTTYKCVCPICCQCRVWLQSEQHSMADLHCKHTLALSGFAQLSERVAQLQPALLWCKIIRNVLGACRMHTPEDLELMWTAADGIQLLSQRLLTTIRTYPVDGLPRDTHAQLSPLKRMSCMCMTPLRPSCAAHLAWALVIKALRSQAAMRRA